MPGNLARALPITVLPNSLCLAFEKSLEYFSLGNTYKDGSSQRSTDLGSPRRTWKLARRLPPTVLATLAAFYAARNGPHQPYFYYDPFEPEAGHPIGSNYDATGVSTQWQYTVRFEGAWKPSYGMGRSNVAITLVEIL
jgi:hypothetical protein